MDAQRDICPPVGARTPALALPVRPSASSWTPRRPTLTQRPSTLFLPLSRAPSGENAVTIAAESFASSSRPRLCVLPRLQVHLELLHLLHPSVGRDLPEVSDISRVRRRRVHGRRDPDSDEPRRCFALASFLPSESH